MCDKGSVGDVVFSLQPDHIDPADVGHISDELKKLAEAGAKLETWFKQEDLKDLKSNVTLKVYTKVMRKGFRGLFGMHNVQVKALYNKGIVRVFIKDIKRVFLLACVRRIWYSRDNIIRLNQEHYSVINSYQEVDTLADLIPTSY